MDDANGQIESPPLWTPTRPFQALALTGGGYRGLFTASVLRTIEDHIQAPIGSRFDLITGTSIGGIVSIAAAFEIPMHQVVSVFEKYGEKIFKGPNSKGTWRKRLDLIKYARRARYSASALREAVEEIIPGGSTLANAIHAVAIPAVNVTQGRPQVFKTRHRADWTRDAHYPVADIALATAAAPTYFELAELDGSLYVDGGLFANAPDLIAIHEAETFFSVPTNSIRVLSVGATAQSYSLPFSSGKNYGIADWMQDARLFAITISAQQQFADQIVRHRLKECYVRIDHEPSPEQSRDIGLDKASPSAQKTLTALGKKAASDILGTKLTPFLLHEPQLKVLETTEHKKN